MVTEPDKTLEALQTAIQMEIDGKECYLQANRESRNELGKQLLESLAAEEDLHRQKFEEIYNTIRSKRDWPKIVFQSDGGRGLRTMFSSTCRAIGIGVKPLITELDAIQTAMVMENESYDFYKSQSKNAFGNAERDFYEALAAQERQHYLLLLDYYEYLKDPAAWFVEKERPSLNGG